MEFSDIKKGAHLVLKKQFPCKIIDVKVSKTGKHGHAKKRVTGTDVITDKKHVDLFVHSDVLVEPEIIRTNYQLSGTEDEYLALMSLDDFTIREDLKMPSGEIGDKIQSLGQEGKIIEVTVLTVKFNDVILERIVECKEAKI